MTTGPQFIGPAIRRDSHPSTKRPTNGTGGGSRHRTPADFDATTFRIPPVRKFPSANINTANVSNENQASAAVRIDPLARIDL